MIEIKIFTFWTSTALIDNHDAIVLDMLSSDDLPRQEQGIHVLDLCNALPQQ